MEEKPAITFLLNLHIAGSELWLSANFVMSAPALAAANCLLALTVIDATDVPRSTETQS